jgi:excisionase family DNA binding protein
MGEPPILLTVPKVASLLAVSPRTVEELLAREELPSLLIGRARRIRRSDVDDYVTQRLDAEKDAVSVHVRPLAPDAPFIPRRHRPMPQKKIRPSVTSRTDREVARTSGRTSKRV